MGYNRAYQSAFFAAASTQLADWFFVVQTCYYHIDRTVQHNIDAALIYIDIHTQRPPIYGYVVLSSVGFIWYVYFCPCRNKYWLLNQFNGIVWSSSGFFFFGPVATATRSKCWGPFYYILLLLSVCLNTYLNETLCFVIFVVARTII